MALMADGLLAIAYDKDFHSTEKRYGGGHTVGQNAKNVKKPQT